MVQPFSRKQDLRPQLTLPACFDFDPIHCRAYFEHLLTSRMITGKVPILSYEALVGNPHGGSKHNSKVMADRLYSVIPEARIVIVIREQQEMIFSTYRQFIKIGGTSSLKDYLTGADKPGNRIQPWAWQHFCYDALIHYYQLKFGKSRVLVLPYEEFARAPLDFLGKIATFSGIDTFQMGNMDFPVNQAPNHGLSKPATELRRYSNRLFQFGGVGGGGFFLPHNSNQRLHGLFSQVDRYLPDSLKSMADHNARTLINQWIAGRYRSTNRRTFELTGLPLDRLAYDI